MKKLLLLIPALFLAGILFTSCQQEPTLVEPGNQEKVTITGTGTNCTPIMAGQNIVAGTVCLDDIDTNGDYIVDALQVVYTTTGDWELKEIHFAVGLNSSSIPRNRKGNLVPGQFPYKAENLQAGTTTYTITIPFSSLGYICGNLEYLYAAAHCVVGIPDGSGGYTQTETGWGQGQNPPGGNWAMFFTFKIECDVLEPPPPPKPHETAFAHGCENATCFSAIAGEDFSRWGWTNKLEAIGRYSFDLYAGAGQCNLNAGTLVGEVIVEYDGSTALVTFTTCGPYTMDETHLYVGSEILPSDNQGDFTVAPGQYPYKHDDFETPVTTDSYTITGLSGTIYVVAHATVYSNTDFSVACGEVGCEFEADCDEWIVFGSKLTTGDDILYKIDLNNKTFVEAYNPGIISSQANYPNGNAYDPVNERLYFGTDNGVLYYHELGTVTHVQVTTGLGNIASGCWYDGVYYWVKNGTNQLWKLNGTTATQVGTVPTSNGYGDIVFDPANPGWLIGSAGSGTAVWYAYDLNTNTHSVLTRTDAVGSPGHKQLAFGSDGVLYAVDSGNTGGAVQGRFYTAVVNYAANEVALSFYWDSGLALTDLASGPQCQ